MQHYETHLFARFQKVTTLDDFFKMKLECQSIQLLNGGLNILEPDYSIKLNECHNSHFIEELINRFKRSAIYQERC